MTTGRASDYVLFNPTKRAANKSLALRIAAKYFNGKIIDKATIETSEWGICHVAAYTDLVGAMIATTQSDVQFGDVEWHSKGRIIMVREHPKKMKTPARITFYICEIKNLFENKSVGYSGVKWGDVSKVKLFVKTLPSTEFSELANADDA
jgi:hypothetical protein